MRFLFCAVSIFLALPGTASADSGLRLTFRHDIVTAKQAASAQAGGKPSSETTSSLQIVTLFPQLVDISENKVETIYDFTAGTLTIISAPDQRYFKTSLYAVAAFNAIEKANQKMLVKAAASAAVSLGVEPFDLDMEFGGPYDATLAGDLHSSGDTGHVRYKYRGEDIASYQLADTIVADALKESYAHLLVYDVKVHPLMRKDMLKSGHLLQSLRVMNHNANKTSTDQTLTLIKAEPLTEALPVVPAAYRIGLNNNAALGHILDTTTALPPPAENISRIRTLANDKKYLDAAIVALGHFLMYDPQTAADLKPLLQSLVKQAPDDSLVKETFAICSAQPSPQTAAANVQMLRHIQTQAPLYSYFLNGCLALQQDALNKPGEAQALRTDALEKNPFLVTVLKDMGDSYYRQYDTYTAWALWNKARQINPAHGNLRMIAVLEAKLKQAYPEYF